ncbi:hypothetical protein [Pseudonocardia zijingensis]|uniref:Uncharacterized protein n=1 Tax=Pseudonocardia zijingensis TaxID=153376 RepID=A0ABN1NHJ5_9PSEU
MPWPARAGAVPDADARVEGHRLTVWFGAESAPALTLAPVPLGP